MSKADEMFEKIGYEKKQSMVGEIYKAKKKCVDIYFIRPCELIEVAYYGDNKNYFDIKELQAINEKCKELGWYE